MRLEAIRDKSYYSINSENINKLKKINFKDKIEYMPENFYFW